MTKRVMDNVVITTFDSLKNFKKILGSTALATTLVATSLFTGLTGAANAADVTVTAGETITIDDIDDEGADDNLIFSTVGNHVVNTAATIMNVVNVSSANGDSAVAIAGTGSLVVSGNVTSTDSLIITVGTGADVNIAGNTSGGQPLEFITAGASTLFLNGGTQAIARSNIQGKSLNAIAQSIDTTNRTNLNIMNRAASQQAQMDAQIDKAIDKGLYDDTVFALQNKTNFDNEKIAKNNELFNAMMTNASNTYNLNTLYDYYNINPQGYGDVEFTENGQQLYKANQQDRVGAFYDRVIDYEKNTGNPMPAKTQELLYNQMVLGSAGNASASAMGTTKGEAEMQQRGIPGYPGSNVQLKRGKEIKKLPKSFPFGVGKMGA